MRVINYSHMRQQETCEFEIYGHMTGNREKLFENIHFPRTGTRQRAHKYPNTCSVRGISLFLFCAVANLKNLVRCGGTWDVLLVCSRTPTPPWGCLLSGTLRDKDFLILQLGAHHGAMNRKIKCIHSLAHKLPATASFCFAHINVHIPEQVTASFRQPLIPTPNMYPEDYYSACSFVRRAQLSHNNRSLVSFNFIFLSRGLFNAAPGALSWGAVSFATFLPAFCSLSGYSVNCEDFQSKEKRLSVASALFLNTPLFNF